MNNKTTSLANKTPMGKHQTKVEELFYLPLVRRDVKSGTHHSNPTNQPVCFAAEVRYDPHVSQLLLEVESSFVVLTPSGLKGAAQKHTSTD